MCGLSVCLIYTGGAVAEGNSVEKFVKSRFNLYGHLVYDLFLLFRLLCSVMFHDNSGLLTFTLSERR